MNRTMFIILALTVFLVFGIVFSIILAIISKILKLSNKSNTKINNNINRVNLNETQDDILDKNIINLISENEKNKAIELYKSTKNVDYNTARTYIELIDENIVKKYKYTDLNNSLDNTIIDLIKNNKKVEAIKYYKEETGADLVEAKEYIDNIANNSIIMENKNEIDIDLINRTIFELLEKDHKISAIKYYKDKTGVGLAEAKEYVDNIANNSVIDLNTNTVRMDKNLSSEELNKLNLELQELLYMDKKIEAIKLYRERTGKNLKASKEYIESL